MIARLLWITALFLFGIGYVSLFIVTSIDGHVIKAIDNLTKEFDNL
jgi:hypothetical protein